MPDPIHDGPFLTPLAERDRWPGAQTAIVIPDKMASGNLPSGSGTPQAVSAVPFKNLTNGR